jgi:hypothetical protein
VKKLIRNVFGFIVVSPFIFAAKVLSVFVGEKKSVEIIGPIATNLAKQSLKFWVPKIDNSDDFDVFPGKMKKNFWIWRPFYDIEITEETDDVFRLHVSNCPFCEVLNRFGLSKLSAYVCEGDWAIAKDNSKKWLFERSHQIGTGDRYCNHTYKRLKTIKQENGKCI